MCGCSCAPAHRGPGQQPRHVPWLGIKPATLWFTGHWSIHWATPARTVTGFYCVTDPFDTHVPLPECFFFFLWCRPLLSTGPSLCFDRVRENHELSSISANLTFFLEERKVLWRHIIKYEVKYMTLNQTKYIERQYSQYFKNWHSDVYMFLYEFINGI